MMLNNEECTLVAASYAHKIVKERMEEADNDLNDLIRCIVKRRVSKEILELGQRHAKDIVPTDYLRFVSLELKEVAEVPNPSISIPRLKEISVSEEEFEAIKTARIKVYGLANLLRNFTLRIEELLKGAGDTEIIAEIMPEIMLTLQEVVTDKEDDGTTTYTRKKRAKEAYQEFKRYMKLQFNNPSCL